MKSLLKYFVFCAYIVIMLFLIGNSYQSLNSEEKTAPERKVTLSFRHFWINPHDVPIERIFQDVIEQFEQEHPNVKIEFEGMDQTIHREQKLKSEMVTGTQPDIFALFGGAEIEPYVNADRLLDLTPFLKERGLESQFRDLHLWEFGDRVYGLPIEGNAEPLFYNRELFDRLDLDPPKTIAQLKSVVRILKEKGYIPLALGNNERWPAAIYAHYLMDRYAGPDQFLNITQGEASFENDSYWHALNDLAELGRIGAFPDHANQLGREEAIKLFTEGEAAMYLNGNWDITLFQNGSAPEDFKEKVGVTHFPALAIESLPSLAGGYTFGLGVSADLQEDEKQAALEFLAMVYTPEVQTRLVYEALRIPSMSIEINTERTGPIFAQVVELTEQAKTKFIPYDNMISPEVKQTFFRVLAKVIDQEMTPSEALKELEESSRRYWQLRERSTIESKGTKE